MSTAPVNPGTLRVLVADDDPSLRSLLSMTLISEGMRPVEAADGVSALAILAAGLVDLALLDLRMPGLTGEQVLAQAVEIAPDVPILVLTGADRARGAIGLRLGAHDYIAKPFDPLEFVARLRAAARVRAALRAGTARRNLLARELGLMERAALTDELTGLANRRFLRRALTNAATRAARERVPFSLVMLDVDHFKQVNDTAGHDIGDALLQRVGLELARALRGDDVPGRWGGDEFLAVLPATCADAALGVVARIRLGLQAAPLPVPVTTTIGVATGMKSADAVLRGADQALLEAKRAGRNCVRVAPEQSTTSPTRALLFGSDR